ncbi:hypothetical protein LWI29_023534 [Acer saccharum]|uniref:non-specific serine/threonine protein kinase n=1 Tax=Acer saccharum TaxID=4024 RepID=A0AA39S473_ACESA|nr:hypothetical protein LWI29_023534 [Acer saccharum]
MVITTILKIISPCWKPSIEGEDSNKDTGVVFLIRRKRKFAEVLEDWELDYGPHRFKFKDLYIATKGFKDKELLGSGGFGRVYRGVLSTSKLEIAVKRISHESRQGMREFIAEIVTIGRLRHRNLVQLLGYCRRKGELLLVYDYMPNGSLDKYLFDQPKVTLNWSQRFRVIKGVALGLVYLHEEWEQVVIHRDIKASNILLDSDLNGRLGDFGLARLYDHGTDPQTTHIVGTLGYLAPEHTRSGKATTNTDVYAFGAFLLEVASGRRPIERKEDSILVDWVFAFWYRGEILEARDPNLGTEYVAEELELVMKLGLMCSHSEPSARPTMRQVVQYLERNIQLPELSGLGLSVNGLTFESREGVALGLVYLHEEWEQVVIHRDIKASNILLDNDLNGRLGDFDIARLYDHRTDPQTTHIVSTLGYLAPEHTRSGKATTSTDAYAFEAFLLEVASGRRPIEPKEDSILVDWVFAFWYRCKILEARDLNLGTEYVVKELELVMKLGLMCSHSEPSTRPTMRQVVQYLERNIQLPELSGLGVVFWIRRKRKFAEVLEDWELDYGPHRFKFKDLYIATKGFKDKELLGSGGFGRVYRGVLSTSKLEIAVKRISHESRQGMREFIAEIVSIGHLRHRNLVQLLGYCRRKGELLLVYDYMPNGSLDKYLFDQPKVTLNWSQRFQVIKGVALGLVYLHEEWEKVVIHRDIKASNILLDSDLNGRLGDFGLARLYDHGTDPQTTHIVGTLGYLAPEHARSGKATTRTDVYAFGAFLLEVASGRRPIEPKEDSILVDWVFAFWYRGEILEARDPNLGTEYVAEELELVMKLGLMCAHSEPSVRPTMRQVVQYLERNIQLPELSGLGLSVSGLTFQPREGFTDISMSYQSYIDKSFNRASSVAESLLSGGR